MLARKESIRLEFSNGTRTIEIAHRGDGCWEIRQYAEHDHVVNLRPTIHIEQEDFASFLALLWRATIGDPPGREDIDRAHRAGLDRARGTGP